jgi:hypothetical protein
VKKSVCALAAFALVGGIAMAQDAAAPKVCVQARVSANAFTVADLSKASDTFSGFSVPGNDTFGAEYKGDLAEAKFSVTGTLANPVTIAMPSFTAG